MGDTELRISNVIERQPDAFLPVRRSRCYSSDSHLTRTSAFDARVTDWPRGTRMYDRI